MAMKAQEQDKQNNEEKQDDDQDEQLPDHAKKMAETLAWLQAEFENYKKQVDKERLQMRQTALQRVLYDLLPVLDEMDAVRKALGSLNEDAKKGVLMVFKKFEDVLKQYGLEEIPAEGKGFDPFLHEAVQREESDAPAGTVVRVIKKGYVVNQSVLRHALVVVSIGKGDVYENNRH